MSSETLSQNDIDRLLGSDGPGGSSADTQPDVQVYDWRRPHRVSKERLRTITAMYERLVKSFEAWLVSRVRGLAEVRLQSVEQFSFGEFALSLPLPCSSFTFDIAGTGQKGVIDIGSELSTYLIDRLFGGEGSGDALTRVLTPIERMAVRSVADRIATLLQEIWQDHVPMALAISGFESSPEMLKVASREDPVLVANVEFTANAVNSLVLICLPFSVLDKFFSAASQQQSTSISTSNAERDSSRQRSESSLRAAKVAMTARFPEFTMTMRDIAQLAAGTVIPTGIPKDSRVIIRAGTQERFIGHPGRVTGNLAIRILDAVPSFSTLDESQGTP